MNKEYLNIYNNLVNFSRNKDIYSIFTDSDTFSDRLIILMFHFAFFLKLYKKTQKKEEMQDVYDFFFRQLELSIREIGYGDASINKKMKIYINTFHSLILKTEKWDSFSKDEKSKLIKSFINKNDNMDKLIAYFDKYINFLSKNSFNLFLKSVINSKF